MKLVAKVVGVLAALALATPALACGDKSQKNVEAKSSKSEQLAKSAEKKSSSSSKAQGEAKPN